MLTLNFRRKIHKQAILKPGFAGKKLDALERLELAADISFSTDSGNVKEIRELSAFMESENQLDLKKFTKFFCMGYLSNRP